MFIQHSNKTQEDSFLAIKAINQDNYFNILSINNRK